ncbi:hypothetical protein ACWEVD_30200 [Nocardia thailandica]|uniref:TetR family transcriptional regulator n=1 Tax=Nocardia thailandica TaxID=257275 RepID=A0ABW6PXE1_9NOCA
MSPLPQHGAGAAGTQAQTSLHRTLWLLEQAAARCADDGISLRTVYEDVGRELTTALGQCSTRATGAHAIDTAAARAELLALAHAAVLRGYYR